MAGNALRADLFPRSWFEDEAALFVARWLEASLLFEDIQKRSRAIDSVALRIAHPFYDIGHVTVVRWRAHVHNFADSEQRGSEGGTGAPTSCEQSHYAGSLRSGGYAEQAAGTKQTCSDGAQQGRGTGLTGSNWTMTQIANSLQVLERNGGDDGTRTRGLCRDRVAGRRN